YQLRVALSEAPAGSPVMITLSPAVGSSVREDLLFFFGSLDVVPRDRRGSTFGVYVPNGLSAGYRPEIVAIVRRKGKSDLPVSAPFTGFMVGAPPPPPTTAKPPPTTAPTKPDVTHGTSAGGLDAGTLWSVAGVSLGLNALLMLFVVVRLMRS